MYMIWKGEVSLSIITWRGHDTLKKETRRVSGHFRCYVLTSPQLYIFIHRKFSVLTYLQLPVRQYLIKSALNIKENLLLCNGKSEHCWFQGGSIFWLENVRALGFLLSSSSDFSLKPARWPQSSSLPFLGWPRPESGRPIRSCVCLVLRRECFPSLAYQTSLMLIDKD